MNTIDLIHLVPSNTNIRLRENADTRYEDASEMYSSYGSHIISEEDGDVEIQAIDASDLKSLSDEEIAEKSRLHQSTLDVLLPRCREVLEAMQEIESCMEAAVDAYEAGNRNDCIEALSSAISLESDHGDSPATSDLAERLVYNIREE